MQLEYTTILVKDMDESLNFYKKTLGFEIENQLNLPDKTIIFLKDKSGAGIELIKEKNPETGLFGIVFKVNDVKREVQIMKEDNPDLEIVIEQTPNNTLAFTKDPNGVNIILSQ
ncbi:MAG: VOC family protein [Methanobrevibacter sp.]|uniref:VOC family protein n=1 Tax=Methanobrevibacter sp. TaxID=66852 RepID=UPI0026E0F883|nr:VOC family protein [Methanobrevibacter sp.]MDO5848611.1 VOC family protein [Methanobrevibacter sp.]